MSRLIEFVPSSYESPIDERKTFHDLIILEYPTDMQTSAKKVSIDPKNRQEWMDAWSTACRTACKISETGMRVSLFIGCHNFNIL